jgi:predicted transcriptional regulator
MSGRADLLAMSSQIVSAYVRGNQVPASELPILLDQVFRVLAGLANGADIAPPSELTPAVPIKRSVTPEYIVCLEDGKRFKSLKRHLRTRYNMTPDQYRARWGLPPDYPMVAPIYAKARSELAKKMGLGKGKATPPQRRAKRD